MAAIEWKHAQVLKAPKRKAKRKNEIDKGEKESVREGEKQRERVAKK